MNLLHKKLSLPFFAILGLWLLILMIGFQVIMFVAIIIITLVKSETLKPDHISIAITILSVEAMLIFLWRVSTFHRWDLAWLMKRKGVQIKERNPIFVFFSSWFWSFPQGTFDGSFIIAHIYGAYSLPASFPEEMHLKAENVFSTDKIDFISSISGPYDINEEIKIDKSKKTIPTTGVAEIDSVLGEALRDTKDFHARIMFNKEYFRMTVISSTWLGGRYEKRVSKGFEVFRRIDEALRKNYPHKRIVDMETKWNGHKDQFEILKITAVEG